jgi:GxxExxY protein
MYRGQLLASSYRADFICFGEVIVEIKALNELTGNHQAQVINYLKGTGLKKGLLLNLGASSLEHRRIVHNL